MLDIRVNVDKMAWQVWDCGQVQKLCGTVSPMSLVLILKPALQLYIIPILKYLLV